MWWGAGPGSWAEQATFLTACVGAGHREGGVPPPGAWDQEVREGLWRKESRHPRVGTALGLGRRQAGPRLRGRPAALSLGRKIPVRCAARRACEGPGRALWPCPYGSLPLPRPQALSGKAGPAVLGRCEAAAAAGCGKQRGLKIRFQSPRPEGPRRAWSSTSSVL